METVPIKTHPALSVTVTVWLPPQSDVAVDADSPLLHKKLYGVVPPAPVAVASPEQTPLHKIFTTLPMDTLRVLLFTVTEIVLVHPLLSVTVTVYVPPPNPVAVLVVWLDAEALHK